MNDDWTAPHNDVLWRDEEKTLFDPCPSGWRVPQNGSAESGRIPWNAFTMADSFAEDDGRTWDSPVVFGGKAWYPATGLRFYSRGTFTGVRSSAHYLSSRAIDASNSARVFYFVEKEVIIDRIAHRTHGLSVRCIRE